MAILRQDLSLLLFYYLGYSNFAHLVHRLRKKTVATFVTFHDIPREALPCFEANLRFLKRNTTVVSLDDFFEAKLSSQKINVVITFDDGYKSWFVHALPILQRLQLPATFFLSSGYIGLAKADEVEFMRSRLLVTPDPGRATIGLTINDVRKMAFEGFTIGGHTLSHCNLAEARDSGQLRYEIAEDKLRLERITGRKIEYFAYPSGAYHNPEIDVTEILRECGYRGAVTTVSGFNTVETNPYLLHRELTRASMSGQVFRARVYGNYDAVRFLQQWVRMLARRR